MRTYVGENRKLGTKKMTKHAKFLMFKRSTLPSYYFESLGPKQTTNAR